MVKVLTLEVGGVDSDREFFNFSIDSTVACSVIGDWGKRIYPELPAAW